MLAPAEEEEEIFVHQALYLAYQPLVGVAGGLGVSWKAMASGKSCCAGRPAAV